MTEPFWFLKISKNWGKSHSEKGRLHEIVRLTRLGQLASSDECVESQQGYWWFGRPRASPGAGQVFLSAVDGLAHS